MISTLFETEPLLNATGFSRDCDDIRVQGISHRIAKDVIVENHYSHTFPQAVKYRFGLFYQNHLKGVAIFSIPANRFSVTSLFENESQHIGIELTRVFTRDDTPKNFESCCLAKCFRIVAEKYAVIISYADKNFNHVGYLYQALNGWYVGQTAKEPRYLVDGKLVTRRGLGRKQGDTEQAHSKRLLSEGAERVVMDGKHKYLWFVCDKRREKQLRRKLKVNLSRNYPKLTQNIEAGI